MKCFTCNGEGSIVGLFPAYADDVPQEKRKMAVELPCYRCNGTGEVSDEAEQWAKDGRILGDKRRGKKITLRSASTKLNIDYTILSNNELGIIKPNMYLYDRL